MKIRTLRFSICACAMVTFFGTAFAENSKVDTLLNKSAFSGETAPNNLIPGITLSYNPAVIAVVASLKSREPNKQKFRWQKLQLPPHESSICRGPMTAFLKATRSQSPYTFVILPGSYATSTRGSFTHQTVEVLDRKFHDPNIITFAGYLSPEFLRGTCSAIPWDGVRIANDFYARLRILLSDIGASQNQTGVLGFSGGGFLTIGILAADAEAARTGMSRIFGMGGMSFSPILHARTAFTNLDSRHQRSQIDKSLGLTTMDWNNIWYLITHLGPPGWKQIPDLYKANPGEFVDRAFNEFTVVDLADTLEAVAVKSRHQPLSYYNAYVKDGFQNDSGVSNRDVDGAFDRATDVGLLLSKVDRPLLVYFSKDDPILSNSESADQPAAITNVLNEGRRNPSVTVFNPTYGAHTGALLDPIFDDLIGSFFGDVVTLRKLP
jgi:broad specificity phosphatase PhoE